MCFSNISQRFAEEPVIVPLSESVTRLQLVFQGGVPLCDRGQGYTNAGIFFRRKCDAQEAIRIAVSERWSLAGDVKLCSQVYI